ncbi:cobalamin biosynthesis protein CbiX [Xinfangfangia sp. CPCC 101601]|uniref:Cobalamin biosynthesis protein CbiX n=1 Tax=Pseudogemmobacter lacusdianii TaxID=3069608 RepID=A0ABU0VWW5_9RHOB|nr:cobalamin biosynthesis protein CbiX [Xinfangfangia sp. CPCC 101601]MDQ2065998.1 cobalamin biosynthesis protein CbiX [Xinfangfangia sp. CPCC 101601]
MRALIVAHGQPSDPGPAARALEALAGRVAVDLPGWQVAAATLAEPGRLAETAKGEGLLFPLFMASGWFTRKAIPARLAEAGAGDWQMLTPLGEMQSFQDLAVTVARESGAARLVLAAHGSGKAPEPAAIADHVAGRISAEAGIAAEARFIDHRPQLLEATGYGPDSACLPYFAMSGEHVERDIPDALARAGFQGRILPALGLDVRVPGLIAAALRAAL